MENVKGGVAFARAAMRRTSRALHASCPGYLKYEITKDGINIYQEVEWLESIELSYAYLTMLPIKRTLKNGIQITDTARIDGYIYDVSTPDKVVESGAKTERQGVSYVEIFGDEFIASIEIIQRPDIDSEYFLITNADQYNKLYFTACKDYTTTIGEKMVMESKFKIEVEK